MASTNSKWKNNANPGYFGKEIPFRRFNQAARACVFSIKQFFSRSFNPIPSD